MTGGSASGKSAGVRGEYWHDAGIRQLCVSLWRLDVYVTLNPRRMRQNERGPLESGPSRLPCNPRGRVVGQADCTPRGGRIDASEGQA